MNTIISNNLKRTSERIDPAGNIIDARTKQIIKPIEPEYVPTVVSQETPPQIPATTSKIDSMISNKIEEIINRKIEEALSKL